MNTPVRFLAAIRRRALAVPLVAKLMGANIVIVLAAVALWPDRLLAGGWSDAITIGLVLGAACLASLALIKLALRPVEDLERLARQVSEGNFDARAAASPYADSQLAALGSTINALLDALAAERTRIQALGAEVIYAQDGERARVSRELHDSVAQTLAAARFQLASARTKCAEPDTQDRLTEIGSLMATVMDEVRLVSYSLHPRVAEDLGLESALRALAAQVRERSGVKVTVESGLIETSVPRTIVATLFRVAQESLRNIETHARARTATVAVFARPGSIGVEVTDDGCGFDTNLFESRLAMTGLASARGRVALAGGVMKINSATNRGTRILAEMRTPLHDDRHHPCNTR